MVRRFYLSTRKDRVSDANAVRDALKQHGWTQTFDWGATEASKQDHAEIALAEIEGVRDAGILIVLMPGGFGTHVEIGAALALGKPVILHAPNEEVLQMPYPCVFHYHPNVKILISEALQIDQLLSAIGT
jgi:nucleoside 2-deoxyribosyltransferase